MGLLRLAEDGRVGFVRIGAFILACLVIFIQEGISYYVSVQMAALLFLIGFLFLSGARLRVTPLMVFVSILFILILGITMFVHPATISENSPHIAVTTIGVIGYVALMMGMANLRLGRVDQILSLYKYASAMTLVLTAMLVAIADLEIVSSFNREYLILQNIDLVTNYSSPDILTEDIRARKSMGRDMDMDLFYGEQSFLSLVIFVCMVSYIISSRALDRIAACASIRKIEGEKQSTSILILFLGLGCMLYVRSFSSLFFATIICAFLMAGKVKIWHTLRFSYLQLAITALIVTAAIMVILQTYPYYLHRLTTFSDSFSAQQRFGIIVNFLPQDFMFGLHDADRMPAAGIHNGVIYIVMMGGIGGIGLITYLFYRACIMARTFRLAVLAMLAVLAVFFQNGAILSPNKLVILSFLLVPLSCISATRREEAQGASIANAPMAMPD